MNQMNQNNAVRPARSAKSAAQRRSAEPNPQMSYEDFRAYRAAHPEEVPHHSRRKQPKKHTVLKVLLLLLVCLLGYTAFKTVAKGKHWTIAVFGVDSRDGNLEKGTRSDVIMLVNIDQKTGEVRLCSVFRDTYLNIGDETYNKINAAYERGGHKQAVKALEDNLDVKIDDYITFNWAAVAKGINVLGGVDLELSKAEFSYINGFITETVNSTGIGSQHLTHAGMNHLDGVQAVAYGRLRKMDTDFNRTARQRKIISLALDKAKAADPATLISVATNLLPEVSTSIDIGDIVPIIKTLSKYNIPEDASSGFPFARATKNIGKLDCVIPTTLESNVVTLHQFLFGEEDYTPSSTVRKYSNQIASDSGFTEVGENAPEAKIGGGIPKKDAAPVQTDAVMPPDEPLSDETLGDSEFPDGEFPENESDAEDALFPDESDADAEDAPDAPENDTDPAERGTAEDKAETASPRPTEINPDANSGPGALLPGGSAETTHAAAPETTAASGASVDDNVVVSPALIPES